MQVHAVKSLSLQSSICKLPRLQLVFFYIAISRLVVFFITVIASNLRDLFCNILAIISLFFLALCSLSDINSSCVKIIILTFLSVLSSLVRFFFLFFPNLILSFLGLSFLLVLVDLILNLNLASRIRFLSFVKLITRVSTDLKRLFF